MSIPHRSGTRGSKDCHLYWNIIMYWKWQHLKAAGSTPGWDRHISALLTFLYEIESLTTFIWRNFWHNAYFSQHSDLKWIYFAVLVHFNILKMGISEARSSPLGGDRHAPPDFFVWSSILSNFHVKKFSS